MHIHKKIRWLLMLLVSVLVISACGRKSSTAEKYLMAIGDGDSNEALEYMCDDLIKNPSKINLNDVSTERPADIDIRNVSCEYDRDNIVICDYEYRSIFTEKEPEATEDIGSQDVENASEATEEVEGDSVEIITLEWRKAENVRFIIRDGKVCGVLPPESN